jgi:hypothetical protein
MKMDCNGHKNKILFLLLCLAFVRGVIYLAVMPPWQHYDEPTHLKRLRLVAELVYSPDRSEHFLSTPQEIIASMYQFNFWGNLVYPPEISDNVKHPPTLRELGISHQLPYYLLSAPFQIPLRYDSIEIQLYVGRVVSVAFYALTVFVAYSLMRELFPEDQLVWLMVPALIAFIPAYTDLMSAINNDVGAVAAFSFLLWGIVRLVRRGFSLLGLVWVIVAAGFGFFTKRTTAAGLLLVPMAMMAAHRRWSWRAWGIGAAISLVLLASVMRWSASACWYEFGPPSTSPIRVQVNGPVGQYAIYLDGSRYLVQELHPIQTKVLRGKVITLGGWVKAASDKVEVHTPSLYDGFGSYGKVITATQEWHFHAITTTVSPKAKAVQVRLSGAKGTMGVLYEGVVLVEGEFPLNEAPIFDDADASTGTWGGRPFVNLLANGSGEKGWPRLQPWFSNNKLLVRIFRHNLNLVLHSILDWRRTGWVYRSSLIILFQSFWARFGWNHIMVPDIWYWALWFLTAVGFGGFILFLVRRVILSSNTYHPWQRRALMILIIAFFLVWGGVMICPHPILATLPRYHFRNVARYAYPAIIPTVTFLFLGWRELSPHRFRRFLLAMCLVGLALLDAACLVGVIIPFYYYH